LNENKILKAKKRLEVITKLTDEAQELSEHILTLRNRLESPTSSIIVMSQNNNGGKSRAEVVAELLDLIDDYEKLVLNIERERLTLLSEIDSIEDKSIAFYLKMRYAYGQSVHKIAYNNCYSERQVNRFLKKGIELYVIKYDEVLSEQLVNK
jgi:hypothetical protein